MFEIIMVSHGGFARALKESAELIVGEQENIQTFGLFLGDDVEALKSNVRQAITEAVKTSEVLVLTDMMSGSPFNVTAALMENIEFKHITGMNLPMLLEILSNREYESLSEICKNIVQQGKATIIDVNELLKEVSK